MAINPRVALATRSADDGEHSCLAAVLELSEDVIYRLDKCATLITTVHDDHDSTINELRFRGAANIWLYGDDMGDWLDCMGAWGRNWHSELSSNRIALMPSNWLQIPCSSLPGSRTYELVVTKRHIQPAKLSWRFSDCANPFEFYTDPLPLDLYEKFYGCLMHQVPMERVYDPS